MYMKSFVTTLAILALATFAFCQTNILQEGNTCFDRGDYACAVAKYDEAYRASSGRDQQIAEIRRGNARSCAEWLKIADQALKSANYNLAKENYQYVVDANPKDSYAKKQLDWCNQVLSISLSVSRRTLSFSAAGGNETIVVRTNADSYSIGTAASWYTVVKNGDSLVVTSKANPLNTVRNHSFTITAGVKTETISVSQSGKLQDVTLTLSRERITVDPKGGKHIVDVKTDASDYQIRAMPVWCTVTAKRGTWFSLSCNPNTGRQARTGSFVVVAGNKQVSVILTQAGTDSSSSSANTSSRTSTSASRSSTITTGRSRAKPCFNCPKTREVWGLAVGYIQMAYDPYSEDDLGLAYLTPTNYWEGWQFGLRIEPLFKYGFGLNTGIFYEYYSRKDVYYNNRDEVRHEYQEMHAFSVPLHLEYRLNFSKWFNLFAYGGVGINAVKASGFEDYSWPTTVDYGGGVRINRIQFNLGKSSHIGNLNALDNFGSRLTPYHDFVGSISYMF